MSDKTLLLLACAAVYDTRGMVWHDRGRRGLAAFSYVVGLVFLAAALIGAWA